MLCGHAVLLGAMAASTDVLSGKVGITIHFLFLFFYFLLFLLFIFLCILPPLMSSAASFCQKLNSPPKPHQTGKPNPAPYTLHLTPYTLRSTPYSKLST